MRNVLITGAAGFIGFHLANFHQKKVTRYLFLTIFSNLSLMIMNLIILKKKNVNFFKVDLTKK